MRRFYTILFLLLTTYTSFAITPIEVRQQIDKANAMRSKDSRSSVQPLYAAFMTANEQGWNGEGASALAYMGWALYNIGYPELSMQVFSYAQNYCPEDSTKLRDLITLGMGACYASTTDFVQGEKHLLEGLQQSQAAGNKREEMMIYTYLGNIYSNLAKESKAKECFEKGRDIAHALRDTLFESALYCNVGTLEPDVAEAEAALFRSIDLSQQAGDKTTECYAYVNLSELYFNNKEYTKALRTSEQINRMMPYIKSNDRIITYSHSLLSQIYAAQNDYASAYSQMSQALHQQQIDESSIEQERIKYSQMVTEIVKLCEKGNLQRLRQETSHTLLILMVVMAAIMIVAVVLYVMYRKSRKQQKQLALQNRKILQLQETSSEHISVIHDTRRTMNYFYGFYRGRQSLLEKLSAMVKEGYKMTESQLPAHLRMLNNTITQSLAKDKEPDFVAQLHAENEEFVKRLLARYPDLSKTDIQLAVFYRLGMSTREISRLSGKLTATVTTARYRLRTSLGIAEDVDLTEFFESI